MGISGLLPFAKAASTDRHISYFRGQIAAIDSYCWLHKGAFGCAEKLVKGEQTQAYVKYCFKYINMLLHFKIKPVMVFDGRHLPAKLQTETKRREGRQKARKLGVQYLKLGKIDEARTQFRKCIDITPEMALALIKECRSKNIDCVVAPYEADAQLAYLNIKGIVDFIISEDSDLLPFGSLKVLFKLDLSGTCILAEADKLHLTTKERLDTFSVDRFRHMCILSGCDYLDSLPGVGLKKALKFLKRVADCDIYESIPKLPMILNMRHISVTKEYRDQFMIADATFRHQLVFDVFTRCLVPLTDPSDCGTKLEYCCNAGEQLDDHIAFQIAIGNMNPLNLNVMDNWSPKSINFNSIWSKSYKRPEVKTKISYVLIKEKTPEKQITEAEDEEDSSKENLLKMYSVQESPAKKICRRDSNEEKLIKERLTSPVLSRRQTFNPFVKKTPSNNNNQNKQCIVISKYFMPKTESINDQQIDSNESNSENVDNDQIDHSQIDNEINNEEIDHSQTDNEINDNSQTSICTDLNKTNDEEEINNTVNSENNDSNENSAENKDEDQLIVSNNCFPSAFQFNRKVSFQSNRQTIKTVVHNTSCNSNSNSSSVSNQKKTCRRIGLSKTMKYKSNENQQTILSMYGFTYNKK